MEIGTKALKPIPKMPLRIKTTLLEMLGSNFNNIANINTAITDKVEKSRIQKS